MIILFRKADGFLKYTSLYEWQPEDSSNGAWYRIREENIAFFGDRKNSEPYVS